MILVNLNDLEFTFRKSNHLFLIFFMIYRKKLNICCKAVEDCKFFDLCQCFYFSFRSTLS